jgi:hypothetical protein
LQNTQKFNKIDPTKYIRKIDHPTLENVYAEYNANKAYDADSLTFIGRFTLEEREPTEDEIVAMTQQSSGMTQQRDVMGLMDNLAKGVRL